MEAVTFRHYLSTQTLLTYDQAAADLQALCAGPPAANEAEKGGAEAGEGQGEVLLTPEDYLLGLFDLTGEMMRFAVTSMATSHSLPTPGASPTPTKAPNRTTLDDLRTLLHYLSPLPLTARSSYSFARDAESKLRVAVQSVEKVERALYGVVVRGGERPKGWAGDGGERRGEEVEVGGW